jgi:hypothetical protein
MIRFLFFFLRRFILLNLLKFGEKRGGKTALVSQLKRGSSTTPSPQNPPAAAAPSSTGLTIHEWTIAMNVAIQDGRKVKEGSFHIWEFSERGAFMRILYYIQ